jgi:hypothetical protein
MDKFDPKPIMVNIDVETLHVFGFNFQKVGSSNTRGKGWHN